MPCSWPRMFVVNSEYRHRTATPAPAPPQFRQASFGPVRPERQKRPCGKSGGSDTVLPLLLTLAVYPSFLPLTDRAEIIQSVTLRNLIACFSGNRQPVKRRLPFELEELLKEAKTHATSVPK